MSHLQVRRIPFTFEGVEFIWNPSNPGFAILMNMISFMVIGLEKYMCLAMRDAEPLIQRPDRPLPGPCRRDGQGGRPL